MLALVPLVARCPLRAARLVPGAAKGLVLEARCPVTMERFWVLEARVAEARVRVELLPDKVAEVLVSVLLAVCKSDLRVGRGAFTAGAEAGSPAICPPGAMAFLASSSVASRSRAVKRSGSCYWLVADE